MISFLHSILDQSAIIVVDSERLTEWEEAFKTSSQLFDTLPELTSDISDSGRYEEIYLVTDTEIDAPFVFSFADIQEPKIPDLKSLYTLIATGDVSSETATEYIKIYEELARIAGSLTKPYKKAYLKCCRILDRTAVPFRELQPYEPTREEIFQKMAEKAGFDHIDTISSIDLKIPEVIQSLSEDGELLEFSSYPPKLFWIYHFDQVFDQAVIAADAVRDLAIENKYEDVKKVFKEKIKSV